MVEKTASDTFAWPDAERFDPSSDGIAADLKLKSRLVSQSKLTTDDACALEWTRVPNARSVALLNVISAVAVLATLGLLIFSFQRLFKDASFQLVSMALVVDVALLIVLIRWIRRRSDNHGLLSVRIDLRRRVHVSTAIDGTLVETPIDSSRPVTVVWRDPEVARRYDTTSTGLTIFNSVMMAIAGQGLNTSAARPQLVVMLPSADGGEIEFTSAWASSTKPGRVASASCGLAAYLAQRLGAPGVARVRESIAELLERPDA